MLVRGNDGPCVGRRSTLRVEVDVVEARGLGDFFDRVMSPTTKAAEQILMVKRSCKPPRGVSEDGRIVHEIGPFYFR